LDQPHGLIRHEQGLYAIFLYKLVPIFCASRGIRAWISQSDLTIPCLAWYGGGQFHFSRLIKVNAMANTVENPEGRAALINAMLNQKLVEGDQALAAALAQKIRLKAVDAGESIIEQGGKDNNLCLIVAGLFEIIVNGRVLTQRTVNDHVGEMALIEPGQARSATVRAINPGLVAVLSASDLFDLGREFPDIYLRMARELSQRLLKLAGGYS
jgi:CRP-like cAMP-binding protein